jgi:glycosyltransferase involved in cell wall biosynthesis
MCMEQRPHVIIFSTAYFPLVGGAEVAMKETTDRIPDVTFDLICARIKKGLADTERIGNITVHRCGFGSPIDKYLLPIFGVWRATRLARTQDVSAIWSLMASYGGFAALVYTWVRPNTKMLLTLQEGDPLEHYAKRTGLLTFLHKAIFRRANAVHAISTFLAQWARDMGFGGTPEVVPNGVDIARFTARISSERRAELRHQMGYAETDVVLVTASRLTLKNGVNDLIQSLTSLPTQYKVLIIGEGEDQEKLTALTKQHALEPRICFLGKKGHDELPGLLQASDIFVRASLSEGLGNSFLEAMACGIPIIGTPVGGIPDFLTDGETGVFCQPRDPASLARAAQRIQEEPGLRQKLIVQGEQCVRNGYGWEGIASRLRTMLYDLRTR